MHKGIQTDEWGAQYTPLVLALLMFFVIALVLCNTAERGSLRRRVFNILGWVSGFALVAAFVALLVLSPDDPPEHETVVALDEHAIAMEYELLDVPNTSPRFFAMIGNCMVLANYEPDGDGFRTRILEDVVTVRQSRLLLRRNDGTWEPIPVAGNTWFTDKDSFLSHFPSCGPMAPGLASP